MARVSIEELPPHPLLAGLDGKQLARMVETADRRRLAAGDSLFFMGDSAHRFYIVVEGQLKLYRVSPGGQEKVVELMSPGRTFAEAVMSYPTTTQPHRLPFPTRRSIAARLSLQPETLSRVFARLKSQGLSEIDGPVVRIPDIAVLRELSLTG